MPSRYGLTLPTLGTKAQLLQTLITLKSMSPPKRLLVDRILSVDSLTLLLGAGGFQQLWCTAAGDGAHGLGLPSYLFDGIS